MRGQTDPGGSLACPSLPPHHPKPVLLAPTIGDHGPSDSALAASSGWRLRRPAADRHAARCASRACARARATRRQAPSAVRAQLNSTCQGHRPLMENGECEERAGETDTFTEEKRTPSPIDIPPNETFHSSTGLPKTNVLSVFFNVVSPLLTTVLTPRENACLWRQKQQVTTSAKRQAFCGGKLDILTVSDIVGTEQVWGVKTTCHFTAPCR
jgi:hypothetical protein